MALAELDAKLVRLTAKLARLEDVYLDGGLSKDRYLERREGIQAEMDEIKTKLTARPKISAMDMDELLEMRSAEHHRTIRNGGRLSRR